MFSLQISSPAAQDPDGFLSHFLNKQSDSPSNWKGHSAVMRGWGREERSYFCCPAIQQYTIHFGAFFSGSFSSFVSRRMLPDFAHLLLAESFHTTNYFCFFHLHLYTLVSSRLRKHTLLSRWLHTTLRMTVIISLVLSPICWKLWCFFFFFYGGNPFVICGLEAVKRNVNSTHYSFCCTLTFIHQGTVCAIQLFYFARSLQSSLV